MLKRLQQKWKVNGWQLCLILLVFAITGTCTAWLSRAITSWLGMDAGTFWLWKLLARLFVLVFGYQVILLLTAFVFGQFAFFWQYELKILRWLRMGGRKNRP
ncbi:MAG: DUF6787 family protein [Chitinophagaceae bacterium]